MQSQTYSDIIDEKIVEWREGLEKLETMMERAAAEKRNLFVTRVKELRSAIDGAIGQLRRLDEQETAENTVETKDQILEIFSSIDKNFAEYQEKTPFML